MLHVVLFALAAPVPAGHWSRATGQLSSIMADKLAKTIIAGANQGIDPIDDDEGKVVSSFELAGTWRGTGMLPSATRVEISPMPQCVLKICQMEPGSVACALCYCGSCPLPFACQCLKRWVSCLNNDGSCLFHAEPQWCLLCGDPLSCTWLALTLPTYLITCCMTGCCFRTRSAHAIEFRIGFPFGTTGGYRRGCIERQTSDQPDQRRAPATGGGGGATAAPSVDMER